MALVALHIIKAELEFNLDEVVSKFEGWSKGNKVYLSIGLNLEAIWGKSIDSNILSINSIDDLHWWTTKTTSHLDYVDDCLERLFVLSKGSAIVRREYNDFGCATVGYDAWYNGVCIRKYDRADELMMEMFSLLVKDWQAVEGKHDDNA